MKKYESPKIDFQTIKLNEKIANTCWGYHGTGTELFYDVKGVGYIGFKITSGSCSFGENEIAVNYYNIPIDKQPAAYTEFYNAVINSGGAKGEPYKGEGIIIIPGDPGNMS